MGNHQQRLCSRDLGGSTDRCKRVDKHRRYIYDAIAPTIVRDETRWINPKISSPFAWTRNSRKNSPSLQMRRDGHCRTFAGCCSNTPTISTTKQVRCTNCCRFPPSNTSVGASSKRSDVRDRIYTGFIGSKSNWSTGQERIWLVDGIRRAV